jgi:hypothetical protein
MLVFEKRRKSSQFFRTCAGSYTDQPTTNSTVANNASNARGRAAREGVVMFQRIKDWTRNDWTKIATSRWALWKFERFIKNDIEKFKKNAEIQAAVYKTEVAATERSFADMRRVLEEPQAAEAVEKVWECRFDLGDGVGVQVFRGSTQQEAFSALVRARVKAAKRFA